jgi:uncharacterized protein
MAKPIGPLCNLDCKYCFYLEKAKLFPGNENYKMSDEVLESYIRQYIDQQYAPAVVFAWQGGEPALLGVDFFRKALELQNRYARGKRISNVFQTNGTMLNDTWGEFFAENHFLVGVSIDGPPRLHDRYRVDKKGGATYERVASGIRLLKKHGVEFNTLTVVNRVNSRKPLEVYRFLKHIGSGFIQFIPLVERLADEEAAKLGLGLAAPPSAVHNGRVPPVTDWSVEPGQYGEFLATIFDEWARHDVGRVFVQLFDVTLGNWMGEPPGLCLFGPACGSAMALEHNGDVYSCDHYVYPRYRLGNLLTQTVRAMEDSDAQRQFGRMKSDTLPRYCKECEVLFLCHGECPKHRFLQTPDGDYGLNYLCRAYKRFFRHSAPAMKIMAALLRSGRPPAEIMTMRRPSGH